MPDTTAFSRSIARLQQAEAALTRAVIDNAESSRSKERITTPGLENGRPGKRGRKDRSSSARNGGAATVVEKEFIVSEPDEEDFFAAIRNDLDAMCAAIAGAMNADTCACLLVTQDAATETERRIIMRGASGNLKRTLVKGRELKDVSGYAYPSLVNQLTVDLPAEEKRKRISEWPVTNQIWPGQFQPCHESPRPRAQEADGPG
jgi:hypothetical protein